MNYEIRIDSFGEYAVYYFGFLLANGFKTLLEAENHVKKLELININEC